MHILIIEDEEQLCRSMAEGLRMDGYETDTCFDGEEGLELCMTENYDLILLDLNLPGIDGLEILSYIIPVPLHRQSRYLFSIRPCGVPLPWTDTKQIPALTGKRDWNYV